MSLTEGTDAYRVRHGVMFDPLYGYRALREVDGKREWLSPWLGSDAAAQRHADEAAAAFRQAATGLHARLEAIPNPDIGVWLPTGEAVT